MNQNDQGKAAKEIEGLVKSALDRFLTDMPSWSREELNRLLEEKSAQVEDSSTQSALKSLETHGYITLLKREDAYFVVTPEYAGRTLQGSVRDAVVEAARRIKG